MKNAATLGQHMGLYNRPTSTQNQLDDPQPDTITLYEEANGDIAVKFYQPFCLTDHGLYFTPSLQQVVLRVSSQDFNLLFGKDLEILQRFINLHMIRVIAWDFDLTLTCRHTFPNMDGFETANQMLADQNNCTPNMRTPEDTKNLVTRIGANPQCRQIIISWNHEPRILEHLQRWNLQNCFDEVYGRQHLIQTGRKSTVLQHYLETEYQQYCAVVQHNEKAYIDIQRLLENTRTFIAVHGYNSLILVDDSQEELMSCQGTPITTIKVDDRHTGYTQHLMTLDRFLPATISTTPQLMSREPTHAPLQTTTTLFGASRQITQSGATVKGHPDPHFEAFLKRCFPHQIYPKLYEIKEFWERPLTNQSFRQHLDTRLRQYIHRAEDVHNENYCKLFLAVTVGDALAVQNLIDQMDTAEITKWADTPNNYGIILYHHAVIVCGPEHLITKKLQRYHNSACYSSSTEKPDQPRINTNHILFRLGKPKISTPITEKQRDLLTALLNHPTMKQCFYPGGLHTSVSIIDSLSRKSPQNNYFLLRPSSFDDPEKLVFTVTYHNKKEPGQVKHVRIRIREDGSLGYLLSNQEEMSCFSNVQSLIENFSQVTGCRPITQALILTETRALNLEQPTLPESFMNFVRPDNKTYWENYWTLARSSKEQQQTTGYINLAELRCRRSC